MQMQHFERIENTHTRARDRLVEKVRLKKKTQHYRAAEHRNRKEKLQLEVNIFDLLSTRKTNKHNIDQDIARFTEVQRRFFAQVSQRESYVSPEFSSKYSILPPLTSRRTILKIIKDTLGEKMEEMNVQELDEMETEVAKNEMEERDAPIMSPEDLRIFRTARERRNSRLLSVPSILVEDEETNDSGTKEESGNDDEVQFMQIPRIRVRRPTGSVSGDSDRNNEDGEKVENLDEKSSKKLEDNGEDSDPENSDEEDDVISSVADENDKLEQKQEEITKTIEEERGNSFMEPEKDKPPDQLNPEGQSNSETTAPKIETLVPPLNLALVKPDENMNKTISNRTPSPSMVLVPAYEDYNMITKRKVKQSRDVKMPPCLVTKSEWNLVQEEERGRRFRELKMRHQEQYRSHVEAMKRWLALPPIKA